MTNIDVILMKVIKHFKLHSLSSYEKMNWTDEQIINGLKRLLTVELKNNKSYYERGYEDGFKFANKTAIEEINKNYTPNK